MKMTLSIPLMAGLIASCGRAPDSSPRVDGDVQARAESNLEQARVAGAETYATALYHSAVEALEKGETSEEGLEANGAEDLAVRSMDEAIRVREEAQEAADRAIRSANVLHSLVEKILSHEPPRRDAFPSAARLAELKSEIAGARDAFARGDFAVAGLKAQRVESELSSPAPGASGT